jgi:hypothetical protein
LRLFLVARTAAGKGFFSGLLLVRSNWVEACTIESASAGAFATITTGLPWESKLTDAELVTMAVTLKLPEAFA